jgi:hypothetical protein
MTRTVCTALFVSLFIAGCVEDAAPDKTPAVAQAAAPPNLGPRFHCVAPWDIDWNKALRVFDADIVSPFCTLIERNVQFIPEVKWITNTKDGYAGHPVLYPPGYEPTFDAPIVDFIFKVQSVRYVVNPLGREYVIPANLIEELLTVGDLYHGAPDSEFTPDQYVWPSLSLLGRLPGLPPGKYSVDVHFVMLETTCDGQTDDFDLSCLPPGDSLAVTRDVIVSQ